MSDGTGVLGVSTGERPGRSISVRYTEAVESFVALARTLSPDHWATPTPCSPLWTCRDVLSHVAGIPDDALHGRMDDPASDRWTAEQVERNRDLPVDELLNRWLEQYEFFGQAVESMGEERPPYDCHSHEHDVRQALGQPGNRDSAIIDDFAERLPAMFAELPVALDITFDDGSVRECGDRSSTDRVTLSTTAFDVFRSRLGRRTRGQWRRADWTGDDAAIDAVVDRWFAFGPSQIDIVE